MKFPFTIILVIFLNLNTYSQIQNDAIIHIDSTYLELTEQKIIKHKVFKVTINNKKANHLANFNVSYSPSNKNISITGTIYSNNKIVKKIKTNDIPDNKQIYYFSENDDRIKSYTTIINNYPFTIQWEYTIEYNSPFYLNDWMPSYSENITIENASLAIKNQNPATFSYKEVHGVSPCKIYNLKDDTFYSWSIKNYQTPQNEINLPNLNSFMPHVLLSPKSFKIWDTESDFTSWESFGQFIYTINANSKQLSPESIAYIKDLVKGANSDIEKIKILYNYLQKNTRYVSIQLGSGGWIPMTAEFVHKNKYGDCKALSNYMCCMLQTIGIEAYYTLVYAGKNETDVTNPNFPSNSFNHCIVSIPQEKDTIWLECTSQLSPFNYLGDFTSNRYALLIKPNKSEIVKTQTYSIEENCKKTSSHFYNLHDNKITVDITLQNTGDFYEYFELLKDIPINKQNEAILDYLHISEGNIISYSSKRIDSKTPISELQVTVELNIQKYITQNNIYIPSILFHTYPSIVTKENRVFPFQNQTSYSEIDSITFDIPENFSLHFLPKNIKEQSEFGIFELKYEQIGNKIMITKNAQLYAFLKESKYFTEYCNYLKKNKESDFTKFVISKKL